MSLVFLLLLFVVIGMVAALLTGRLNASMAPPASSRPVTGLPARALTSPDVEQLRFSVGMRGYRMDEVDDALDRLRDEITVLHNEIRVKDEELGRLRRTLAGSAGAGGSGPSDFGN